MDCGVCSLVIVYSACGLWWLVRGRGGRRERCGDHLPFRSAFWFCVPTSEFQFGSGFWFCVPFCTSASGHVSVRNTTRG